MIWTPTVTSENPSPTYPDGRFPGCLPRTSKPGELFPMASEGIQIIPRSEWPKYTGKVSLRPFVKVVLDQDGVGSCACESAAQAIMVARAVAGLPHVQLNPWFIYHHTSHGRDQGSSIDDNLAFIREYGCAPESVWPRSNGWRAKPSKEAYEAAMEFRGFEAFDISNVNEMVSALLAGFAVDYGANGHSVLKVEHLDDRQGLDINSWDITWGDQGFGVWASYSAVNWAYGAWALRVTA